ncbi:MAG: uncharacterized protein KVP18_002709 [Porospora cf. gigantea A]|uniref:uncharacterized protein n=1 Tax=Porospora cf. gigantea A TaxID=2853593 RepID=UPI00355AC956|nr:MAG: hypothetical protein KVP18_002709 [Porospora cf. gigantea A]
MSISDSATENSEINDDPTNIVTDTSTDSSTDTSADSVFSEDSSPIRTTCYGTAHPVDMSMYPGWEEPPVVQPRWHLFNFKLVRGFLGNKTTLGLGYLLALIAMQTAAIAMILEGVYLLWDSKGFMVVPITVGLLGVALGVYGGFVLFNYQISPMRIFLDLFTAFFSLQSIWLAAGFGVVVWQMLRTQVTYWHILTTLSMVMFNLPFAYFYMAFGECIFSAYVFNFRCRRFGMSS